MKQLLPLVERKMRQLQTVMRILRKPISITTTIRSCQEQDKLYAQGRTTPGPVVTNARCGESFHQFGVAFDVAFVVNGSLSWAESNPWNLVGRMGEILGLEWGGRWTTIVDRPHFQLLKGYTLQSFQKGQVNYSLFK